MVTLVFFIVILFTGCNARYVFLYVSRVDGDRPGMMRNSHDWSIPPEVAFRICGIRETFEESGVLLARSQSDFQQESDEMFRPLCGKVYDKLPIDQLKTYRKLVHKDDSKFLEMCQVK